jgi:hypothetical protein
MLFQTRALFVCSLTIAQSVAWGQSTIPANFTYLTGPNFCQAGYGYTVPAFCTAPQELPLARRIGELMAGDPAVLKQVAGQARRVWEQSHTLDGYHNRITKLMEETASAWRAKHETTAPRERK